MDAKWTVYAKRAEFAEIGNKFNIDQVVARVIRNRDVIGDEAIGKYLNGSLSDVHDPSLMKDMVIGCEIIKKKIEEGKKVRIISDYDVDGIMSNYILLDGLKTLGCNISYEIPDRMIDGYGINERIIQEAHDEGIDTLITCDNGIAAFDAVELAKGLGMTVVVTDHHEVPFELNENCEKQYKIVSADAVIDPKQTDCTYPFKGLCGAGVAYKFIKCLYDMMGVAWSDENKYIEMLAIATQCDVMELVDENRIYVKHGLKLLEKTENLGLKALLELNQIGGKRLSSYHLGFVIGPCINATGRLESAKKGLELLLCEDYQSALTLSMELIELNNQRKKMTSEGVALAIETVEKHHIEDKVLVVYMPELHESLAGIVAGRVREKYYRPTLIVTRAEKGILKGSGRSIEGYHMYDELNKSSHLLLKFGGHELAAGFSLEEDRLVEFREFLNKNHTLTDDILTPVVKIDVPMPISYIRPGIVDELGLLEPFGKGNEKPIFAQAGLGIKSAKFMGKDNQFIKILFQDKDGFVVEGVDFRANMFIECIKMWFSDEECDKMLKGLPNNIRLNVAYYPDINEYGGMRNVQIKPIKYQRAD